MSLGLDTRAEVVKLAQVLGVPAEELAYLERAAPDDLRALREQATDALFDGDRDRLHKLALASRLLPSSIAARIAHWALGPLLSARVTGLLDPGKAVDLAKRLPSTFLADIAIELDPRRAREVIELMPATQVAEVAHELAGRGQEVTMGRFVGYLGDEAISAAMERISDASLLRTAFVMEGKDRLDHLLGLIPEQRLASILRAAEQERLWPEALDLLDHMPDQRKGSLAEIAASEGLLESLAESAYAEGLWDSVLPVIPLMSDSSKVTLARLRLVEDRDALASILDAAAEYDLWAALLPLVEHLPVGPRDQVAALGATLPQPVLEHIVDLVNEGNLWSMFVPLAADHMDAVGRERVAQIIAHVNLSVITGIADAVERDSLWPELLRIAGEMRPDQLSRIADRLLAVGLEGRLPAMLAATEATGLWETGLRMLGALDPGLKQRLAPVASTMSSGERARVVAKARDLGLLDELGPIGSVLVGAGA
ncbi:MAG TPA: hypothetical protein VGH24_10370 [Solirubrobacteraceae bacterium]